MRQGHGWFAQSAYKWIEANLVKKNTLSLEGCDNFCSINNYNCKYFIWGDAFKKGIKSSSQTKIILSSEDYNLAWYCHITHIWHFCDEYMIVDLYYSICLLCIIWWKLFDFNNIYIYTYKSVKSRKHGFALHTVDR